MLIANKEVEMKGIATTAASAVAALLLLAGCGGGGGGEADTSVRIDLTGADWAAYAASPWREVNMSGLPADHIFTFTPAADGRYSVAVHCSGDGGSLAIVHATRTELPAIDALCEDGGAASTYRVSGRIDGADPDGADNIGIFLDGADELFALENNSTLLYEVKGVKEGTFDLAVVEEVRGIGYYAIKRYAFKRDVTIDRNLTNIDLNLATEGVAAIEHSFTVTEGEGYAYLITANGTPVRGIGYGGPSDGMWHAASGKTVAGDIYQFVSGISEKNTTKIVFDGRSALTDPGDVTYDPRSIATLDVDVTPEGNITGLDYTPAAESPPLRMYEILMEQSGGFQREIWLTAGWLGSDTSYTLPSLETLAGWKTEWSRMEGEALDWEVTAMMADRTFSEALEGIVEDKESDLPLFGIRMLMHWSMESGTASPIR